MLYCREASLTYINYLISYRPDCAAATLSAAASRELLVCSHFAASAWRSNATAALASMDRYAVYIKKTSHKRRFYSLDCIVWFDMHSATPVALLSRRPFPAMRKSLSPLSSWAAISTPSVDAASRKRLWCNASKQIYVFIFACSFACQKVCYDMRGFWWCCYTSELVWRFACNGLLSWVQ